MGTLRDFYRRHLQHQVLPFWLRARDSRLGGVFTCFTNDGSELTTRHKYTWSQGRYLWIWARMVKLLRRGLLENTLFDEGELLEDSRRTADFLRNYAWLENGHGVYLLTETGEKIDPYSRGHYDRSIFADCFMVLGLAEWAAVSRNAVLLRDTLRRFRFIRDRFDKGEVESAPYPVPSGYRSLAFPMIQLGLSNTLIEAARELLPSELPWLKSENLALFNTLLEWHFDDEGNSFEFRSSQDHDSMLVRHCTPGHSGECLWFMMDAAKIQGVDFAVRAFKILERGWQLGWDPEYGGMLRYVDRDGGPPKGESRGRSYETLIQRSWSYKLWWPHSEWLYLLLRCAPLHARAAEWYWRLHDYVFSTFPASSGMEWIQIRDRGGKPMDEVVALPVKDPFHIVRNLQLVIELLADSPAVREAVGQPAELGEVG